MASRAGRVDKECEVFLRVHLGLSVPGCSCQVADGVEVPELHGGVAVISQQDDSIFGYAGLLCRFHRDRKQGLLCRQRFGPRIFQLKGKLINGVSWIGGRHDASGPVAAPYHCRSVDAVRGEESEDIALAPFPLRLQACSKIDSSVFDLSEGVGTIRFRVEIDD